MSHASFIPVMLLSSTLLVGCASTEQRAPNPQDPWEGMNRQIYSFNKAADDNVLKPVAKGYQSVVPKFVQSGISNFFDNLKELPTLGNDLLQLKFDKAATAASRFIVNSTIGLFGIADPASRFGLEHHKEDFGQTLATWGYKNSNYVMLPILGPSTARDSLGIFVDRWGTPTTYIESDRLRYGLIVVDGVQKRAQLLDKEDALDAAGVDEYALIRNAYLQRREYVTHDGEIPEDLDDYPFDEEDE